VKGKRIASAAVLVLGLGLPACQREGPVFDDTVTDADAVVVTPVAPIPSAPRPSPTPTPDPPEDPPRGDPSNPGGPSDNIPENTEPVARVEARIFFIECGGQAVPGVEAPVGCRIHLDVTPKDSQGRHTRAKAGPEWSFTNAGLVSISSHVDYTPTLTALAPGEVTATCTIDGVTSPPVSIRLK
jgi:hypothetical protein